MRSNVSRSRIGRVRPETVPKPLPLPKWISPRTRRILVYVIAGGAFLAVVVPLSLWAHYRATYVVSRNATVRGTITNVGAQLDGVVTSVEVNAGDKVTTGQVLARFEDRQLRATVQRAQSRLEKATRELELERLAITQEGRRLRSLVVEASARVAASKAQVEAAQSTADEAKARQESRSSLAQGGIIPQEELRTAQAERRTADAMGATARADQKAAEAAKHLAEVESDGLSVREQRIVVLESEIAGFRAELELADADLKAALICAPADGWVVRRIAEPGGSVVVGAPIILLWIGKEIWVEAWIDEKDLADVAVGNPARVNLKPFPDRVFAGVVESVGVSTDLELPNTAVPQPRNERMRTTPVVGVRVRLEESDGLFPGLSAEVGIRKKKS